MIDPGMDQRGEERPKPTRGQRFAAWFAGLLVGFLAFAPAWFAYLLADLAAPLLVAVTLFRERRISRLGRGLFRNQRIVFREELTPALSRRLLWGWARHMTHLAVDFCRMKRITARTLSASIDPADFEPLRALHAEGQGVICVGGHFGVWELNGHLAAVAGLPVLAVSRPTDNPAIDDLLIRIRTAGGQTVIPKWGVLWGLRKALARGDLIGLAADENDRTKTPLFVPFLGTLAATNSTAALLQRRTGAPIAVVTCNRLRRGRFRLRVWEVIRNPRSADRDIDLMGVTREIAAVISRALLAYPEQWLWGARRFQTRPPGEVPGADGLPPQAEPA